MCQATVRRPLPRVAEPRRLAPYQLLTHMTLPFQWVGPRDPATVRKCTLSVSSSETVQPAALSVAAPIERGPTFARWLYERGRLMQLPEVRERCRQAIQSQADVLASKSAISRSRRWPVPPVQLGAREPVMLRDDRSGVVLRTTPASREPLADAARRIAAGRFALLGYPEVELHRPIDFSRDPVTGESWPAKHGQRINYRSARRRDPKWIWELNRLQHVPLLLCAWKISGDDSLRAIACGDLNAWLDQCEPGVGIAWSNGFEPALRAISMALALDGLRENPSRQDSELLERIVSSLAHHLTWIRRYPSLYSSANNHRLAELAAEVVASVLAPELQDAQSFHRSIREIQRLTHTLFHSDGGYAEQSFGYTIFAVDLLLLVKSCLSSAPVNEPCPWLDEVFSRVSHALALEIGDADLEPDFGDRDDGRAFWFDGASTRRGRSVCSALAVASGRSDAKTVARALDATAVWLFGASAEERWEAIPDDRSTRSGRLERTGVVVLRAGKTTARFDVGNLGLGPLYAHGHADALQVTIEHDGEIIVGDPGTGSYFGSDVVRAAFRGTGYHPTVLVDDLDQAVMTGRFLWGRPPCVKAVGVDLESGVAVASHTGYGRLSDPVSHSRAVMVPEEGLVVIVDHLGAAGRHHYSQRWPLAPDCDVDLGDPQMLRMSGGLTAFTMSVQSSVDLRTRVFQGSIEPFLGWWSPRLEAVRPAPLVSVEATSTAGCQLVTAFSIGEVSSSLSRDGDGAARLCRGDVEYCVRWPGVQGLPVVETSARDRSTG